MIIGRFEIDIEPTFTWWGLGLFVGRLSDYWALTIKLGPFLLMLHFNDKDD